MNNGYNNGNINNNQGMGYNNQPQYNNQGMGYNNQPQYNNQNMGYNNQSQYNNQNMGYNNQSQYNNQPQYNNQNIGYNSQPQYNNQNMGYNNQSLDSSTNTLFSQQPVNNVQQPYDTAQAPENLTKGILGALGGALLGSIVLIILYQIGIVAAISGLIMAALAAAGYEKLGGHMSKKGAIATIAVVLVVIFLSYNIAVTIELIGEFKKIGYDMPFFTVFKNIFTYLGNGYIKSSAYWGNLLLVYFFSAMGAVGLLKK